MLTNEDDCSAPTNTTLYSLNNYPDDLNNPDGPDHQLPLQWRTPRWPPLQGSQPRQPEHRLRDAADQSTVRRDRQPGDPPALQLRGQRQRLERAHPRQQVHRRRPRDQDRSRRPDLRRRDHRPAHAVRGGLGPHRNASQHDGELAGGHALLRRRGRQRRQPRSEDPDGVGRELRRSGRPRSRVRLRLQEQRGAVDLRSDLRRIDDGDRRRDRTVHHAPLHRGDASRRTRSRTRNAR